jgi:hypothetical protein
MSAGRWHSVSQVGAASSRWRLVRTALQGSAQSIPLSNSGGIKLDPARNNKSSFVRRLHPGTTVPDCL